MKIKIIVFGITGMLGSMVYQYFNNDKKYKVYGTYRSDENLGMFSGNKNLLKFNASENVKEKLQNYNKDINPDFIINCIGIINNYCNTKIRENIYDAVKINIIFPNLLSKVFNETGKTKIVQIATDCVFSGSKGKYVETDLHNALDVYGKTKSLGEVYSSNFLNIRCSIIGPEMNNFVSLLEWFVMQKDNVGIKGFVNHNWNGVTTLQFAQFCKELIHDNELFALMSSKNCIHYVPNKSLTKFELLGIFKEVINQNIEIIKYSTDHSINRTLSSIYYPINEKKRMYDAVKDLFRYILERSIYEKSRYAK